MLKPVPKKDQPKVIALGVLAVGLAGSAVFQFNSGDPRIAEAAAAKAASKSGTVASASSAAPGGVAAAAAAPGGAPLSSPRLVSASGVGGVLVAASAANMSLTRIVNENGAVYDLGAVGPPTGGKDPFAPIGMVSAAATAAAAAVPKTVAPSPVPSPAAAPPDFGGGRLDNLLNKAGITSTIPKSVSRGGGVSVAEVLNGGGGNRNNASGFPMPASSGGAASAAAAVVALPPPPPPAVMVTGVVMGIAEPGDPAGSSVAVVRGTDGGGAAGSGSSERRFVKVGDSVGNGFVVAQVKPFGIIIKSGSRRVTLHIGEKPALLGAAVTAAAPAAAAPTVGKEAPQNTDKNTNDKNTVFVPATAAGQAPTATPSATATGSPLGDNFRAK